MLQGSKSAPNYPDFVAKFKKKVNVLKDFAMDPQPFRSRIQQQNFLVNLLWM